MYNVFIVRIVVALAVILTNVIISVQIAEKLATPFEGAEKVTTEGATTIAGAAGITARTNGKGRRDAGNKGRNCGRVRGGIATAAAAAPPAAA